MKKMIVIWLCVVMTVTLNAACNVGGLCDYAHSVGSPSIFCLGAVPASTSDDGCTPPASRWECNVIGGPNTVPNLGPGHDHFVGASCGSFYCATSVTDAMQQTGSTDPRLSCATVLPTWSSCIKSCGDPCDDGQGGKLQGLGASCMTTIGQCCSGLVCGDSTDTVNGYGDPAHGPGTCQVPSDATGPWPPVCAQPDAGPACLNAQETCAESFQCCGVAEGAPANMACQIEKPSTGTRTRCCTLAAAGGGDLCTDDWQCCAGKCATIGAGPIKRCLCAAAGKSCGSDDDCCDTSAVCMGGVCAIQCADLGASCEDVDANTQYGAPFYLCCGQTPPQKMLCRHDLSSGPGKCCYDVGALCDDDAQCCNGKVYDEVCDPVEKRCCNPDGDLCDPTLKYAPNGGCCPPYECVLDPMTGMSTYWCQ